MNKPISNFLIILAVVCFMMTVPLYTSSQQDFECDRLSTRECTVSDEIVYEQQQTQRMVFATGVFIGGLLFLIAFLLTLHYPTVNEFDRRQQNVEDIELAFEEFQRKRKR